MLGRANVTEPVWTPSVAWKWSLWSPCIDRIRQMSSTHRRTLGNRSETIVPHVPPGLKSHIGRRYGRALGWLVDGFPASATRRGLGSNVSMCDTPPDMYRKMTRLALPGKCGARGARGLR